MGLFVYALSHASVGFPREDPAASPCYEMKLLSLRCYLAGNVDGGAAQPEGGDSLTLRRPRRLVVVVVEELALEAIPSLEVGDVSYRTSFAPDSFELGLRFWFVRPPRHRAARLQVNVITAYSRLPRWPHRVENADPGHSMATLLRPIRPYHGA